MKKTKLMLLSVLLGCTQMTNSLFAQKIYVGFNVGYGAPMGGESLEHLDFTKENYGGGNGTTTTYEEVKVSLGKGLNAGVSVGYQLTPYVAAELGISYLMGGKSKSKYSNSQSQSDASDATISSNMIRFIPAVVFSAGLEKINPYARLGLVVGTGSIKYKNEGIVYYTSDTTEMKFNGGVAIGFNGSVGATFKLSEKLSLFGELNVVSLTYAPTKGELTNHFRGGQDQLPNYSISQKEIEFVDSYTYNPQNPPSPDEPSKELKQYYSYGSIGLNVGVKISF